MAKDYSALMAYGAADEKPAPAPAGGDKYAALMAYGAPAAEPAPVNHAAELFGRSAAPKGFESLAEAATVPEKGARTTPAPEDRGIADAFAREGSNVFGLGPIFGAATDTAASKIPGLKNLYTPEQQAMTFGQRREAYARELDQAREQHPYATAGAQLARGVAENALLPEAAGAELSPIARATAAGIESGFATGTGEALSHGKPVHEALAEGGKAGLAGGVTGATLATGGQLITRGVPKRLAARVGKGLSEVEKDAIADLSVRDPDVAEAVTQNPHAGVETLDKRIKTMGEAQDPHLDAIDRAGVGALGDYRAPGGRGGFKTQELVDALESRANTIDRQPGKETAAVAKSYRDMAESIATRWDEGSVLGADGQIVRDNVKDLSKAVTPTRELRDLVHRTKDPELRGFLSDYLGQHLEAVGSEGGNEARRAASTIRQIDQDIGTATTLRDQLKSRAGEGTHPVAKAIGHVVTGGGAVTALATGHPTVAAGIVGQKILRAIGSKAGQLGNRGMLAALRREGDNELVKQVLAFVEKGVPITTAIKMAQGVATGAVTRDTVKEGARGAFNKAADTARSIFGSASSPPPPTEPASPSEPEPEPDVE